MIHLIRFILTLCLGIAATAAVALDAANIGVLDWQQLLAKAPQAEEAGKRLDKEFQGPKDKFVNKQKEYQNKRDKLQRDRDTMSKVELAKREKELSKMDQDLRRLDEELRADFNTRQREEMDDFVKIVTEVVDKFASEEKLDVVIPQAATIYASERIDITEKVLERLEKAAKVAKPAAEKKAAGAGG